MCLVHWTWFFCSLFIETRVRKVSTQIFPVNPLQRSSDSFAICTVPLILILPHYWQKSSMKVTFQDVGWHISFLNLILPFGFVLLCWRVALPLLFSTSSFHITIEHFLRGSFKKFDKATILSSGLLDYVQMLKFILISLSNRVDLWNWFLLRDF